ncbi:natural killer cell receptor 2B4-like isoform X1 [Brachyhypopomus gauderio]|uniref:natural killer cell receptor 2B4-like isoform X1 n=1 Tax=Brachyhypopomus gauderio TaxID=698409 RepID=UPI0040435C5A
MAILVRLFVFLSVLIPITVSSDVYKVVGGSLDIHLEMQNIEHFQELKWMFNDKLILIYSKKSSATDFSAYKDRVDLNKTTFSLTLKNLTKNDSGKYIVKGEDQQEIVIASYTLSVLDPVVAPILTYSRPQKSSDTCKVSCESQDLSVSTSCSNETCEAKNAASSNLNLGLHVTGTTVNCTVSNKAMWINTTLDIKLCEVSSDVFKVVGSSVQLHMNDRKQPFNVLSWMYIKSFILKYETKFNIETSYNAKNSRMEFDTSDYSLTVNNLEKSDSGLYKAKLTTDEEERIDVEYRLSVLDPAEIPVFSPVHHQQSDTCNLTCRGRDLSIITNCTNHICENKETSSGGHTLSMFVSGSTIICNHSNPVSWKGSTIEIKEICSVGGTNYLLYTILALSCVALTLLLTVVGCVIRVRRKNTDGIASPPCDTVYAEIENETERPRNGGRLETDGPSTLYSIIGMLPRPSDGSAQVLQNPLYNERNISQNSPSTVYSKVGVSKPETIYGTVKKVNKAADGTPSHMRK